jgi:hypothetical protein
MEYEPFEPGIEVNGQTIHSVVEALRRVRRDAGQYLVAEGIGEMDEGGQFHLEQDAWFSQEAWLRAFRRISEDIGQLALYEIGLAIPRNAKFPEWVTDVNTAVRSIDVAYHMNHRKNGEVMYDANADTMLDGIGHYGYEKKGRREIVSVCENPYPCRFDQGILTTMVFKFQPNAQIDHDTGAPCRREGAHSCTYRITW